MEEEGDDVDDGDGNDDAGDDACGGQGCLPTNIGRGGYCWVFFSWRITSDGLPHTQEKSVPVRTRPVVQNRILPLESFFLLSYLLSPFPPPSSPSLFTGGRGGGSRRRRRCRRRRLRRRRAPREKYLFSIIAGVPVRQ